MVDIREVAIRLQKMGHEVRMFVPHFETFFPRGRILQDPGFEYEKIPFNRLSLNAWNVGRAFRKRISQYHPDIVFLTDGYSLKPYLSEALAEYPQIWRAYSYEIFCPLNNLVDTRLSETCENTVFKDQKWCECCCRYHYNYLRSWVKVLSPFKCSTGYLFLFHEYWFSRANRPEFLKTFEKAIRRAQSILVYNDRQHGYFSPFQPNIVFTATGVNHLFSPDPSVSHNQAKPVILLSGRIEDPVKGFQVAYAACKRLHEQGVKFELWITAKKSVYVPADPFIRNIGWLTTAELSRATAMADIVCIPSFWEEAFGIVAVEAMACAKPVVASRVGGLQKIVEDGHTGFLVEPNSIVDLAEKLQFLIEHQDTGKQMGQNGKKRFDEHYSWERIINSVYLPVFGDPTGKRSF